MKDKRIAPTILVILIIIFVLIQAGVIIWALNREGLGTFWMILILAIPFAAIWALIAVYIERLKEIDDENSDLENY